MDRINKTLRISMHHTIAVVSLLLLLLAVCPMSYGQQAAKEERLVHLPFETVSAEIARFKKPVRLGVGKRVIEYQEALLLIVKVSHKDYDALPPSIEPYMYIGTSAYRIYSVHQSKTKGMLTLVFHIRDWQKLPDKSPMILTILHGEPINNPDLFIKFKSPHFNKSIIQDKRK